MRDKKGMSAVVTTLIMILLVLVAIGIVWVVVKGIVDTGSEGAVMQSKCLGVDVSATVASCVAGVTATDWTCDVTLEKTRGDEIAGVKLVFKDAEGTSSSVIDVAKDIPLLATITETGIAVTGITTPNKVEVTAYLMTEAGQEHICGITRQFNF